MRADSVAEIEIVVNDRPRGGEAEPPDRTPLEWYVWHCRDHF
jgi:hypothetical protein